MLDDVSVRELMLRTSSSSIVRSQIRRRARWSSCPPFANRLLLNVSAQVLGRVSFLWCFAALARILGQWKICCLTESCIQDGCRFPRHVLQSESVRCQQCIHMTNMNNSQTHSCLTSIFVLALPLASGIRSSSCTFGDASVIEGMPMCAGMASKKCLCSFTCTSCSERQA